MSKYIISKSMIAAQKQEASGNYFYLKMISKLAPQ